jgi:hypothetical protein
VPGGLPTELFIAWIIVSKFGDHLPFYRQAEIFKRQGIDLDRGTLGNWVGRACFHLMPVINHMRAHLRGADRIFVDETRAPVLEPGLKRTKSGFFWAVVSDDRGHGGAGPPIVLFHYAPGRGKAHPLNFLAGYRGRFLQCDAYQSYNAMTEIARNNGPWQLVYCWTHVRRRFVKRFESDGSPIAEEMLRQIALIYQIEKSVRGMEAAARLAARREHAVPIIAALKPWIEAQLSRIPQKSQLAEDTPGIMLSATIRARSAFVRRRRPLGPSITSSRETPTPPEPSKWTPISPSTSKTKTLPHAHAHRMAGSSQKWQEGGGVALTTEIEHSTANRYPREGVGADRPPPRDVRRPSRGHDRGALGRDDRV